MKNNGEMSGKMKEKRIQKEGNEKNMKEKSGKYN